MDKKRVQTEMKNFPRTHNPSASSLSNPAKASRSRNRKQQSQFYSKGQTVKILDKGTFEVSRNTVT